MMFPPNEHAIADARLLTALQALMRPPLIPAISPMPVRPIHWSVYRPHVATLLATTHGMIDHIEPDLIIVEWRGERGTCFHIGVRLHWKVEWHHHFRLFLPLNGQAVFVAEDVDAAMHFALGEDGVLEAMQGVPFATLCELDAGLERARLALRDRMDCFDRQLAFA